METYSLIIDEMYDFSFDGCHIKSACYNVIFTSFLMKCRIVFAHVLLKLELKCFLLNYNDSVISKTSDVRLLVCLSVNGKGK